jgi:hypothetical protein
VATTHPNYRHAPRNVVAFSSLQFHTVSLSPNFTSHGASAPLAFQVALKHTKLSSILAFTFAISFVWNTLGKAGSFL